MATFLPYVSINKAMDTNKQSNPNAIELMCCCNYILYKTLISHKYYLIILIIQIQPSRGSEKNKIGVMA
jgi:hypothetical protein